MSDQNQSTSQSQGFSIQRNIPITPQKEESSTTRDSEELPVHNSTVTVQKEPEEQKIIQPSTPQNSTLSIADILNLSIEKGASDIHMAANNPLYFRISGKLEKVEGIAKISTKQAEDLLYNMMNDEQKAQFVKNKDFDFAYKHLSGEVFRVNAFVKQGNIAFVTRMIPNEIKSMEELKLPPICMKFMKAKQGLVLVTGPTGSGKSTTLASMLEWININMAHHVITLEDPVEFIYQSKQSVFSQRTLGTDTHSIANALKGVLREDPDIVVIGEMRDPETIATALTISETGHLVFGTLHTSGAPQTISRMISVFPPAQQDTVRVRVAESLVGVISQRLVTKVGGGRLAIHETFLNTPAFSNMIRTGDSNQLGNAIQTGGRYGMISMEKSAYNLVAEGVVAREDVEWIFTDEED